MLVPRAGASDLAAALHPALVDALVDTGSLGAALVCARAPFVPTKRAVALARYAAALRQAGGRASRVAGAFAEARRSLSRDEPWGLIEIVLLGGLGAGRVTVPAIKDSDPSRPWVAAATALLVWADHEAGRGLDPKLFESASRAWQAHVARGGDSAQLSGREANAVTAHAATMSLCLLARGEQDAAQEAREEAKTAFLNELAANERSFLDEEATCGVAGRALVRAFTAAGAGSWLADDASRLPSVARDDLAAALVAAGEIDAAEAVAAAGGAERTLTYCAMARQVGEGEQATRWLAQALEAGQPDVVYEQYIEGLFSTREYNGARIGAAWALSRSGEREKGRAELTHLVNWNRQQVGPQAESAARLAIERALGSGIAPAGPEWPPGRLIVKGKPSKLDGARARWASISVWQDLRKYARQAFEMLNAAAFFAGGSDARLGDELLAEIETKVAALRPWYASDGDPPHSLIAKGLVDAYAARGRFDEALAIAEGRNKPPMAITARLAHALLRAGRTGEALGVIASDLARASDLSCLELAAPLLAACHAEGTLEASAAAMNEAWREAERALDAFTPGDERG